METEEKIILNLNREISYREIFDREKYHRENFNREEFDREEIDREEKGVPFSLSKIHKNFPKPLLKFLKMVYNSTKLKK